MWERTLKNNLGKCILCDNYSCYCGEYIVDAGNLNFALASNLITIDDLATYIENDIYPDHDDIRRH